jgi:DNA repair protein RadC
MRFGGNSAVVAAAMIMLACHPSPRPRPSPRPAFDVDHALQQQLELIDAKLREKYGIPADQTDVGLLDSTSSA